MASPSTVLSDGLGTWSTAGLLLTLGFGSAAVPVSVVAYFEAVQASPPWLDAAQASPPWLDAASEGRG